MTHQFNLWNSVLAIGLRVAAASLACAVFAAVGTTGTGAQGAQEPVLTAQQVEAGRSTFRETCSACHGRDLGGGGEAPPLAGAGFAGAWKAQSTQYLFKYVQEMPPGGPYLTADQYLDVVAYLLHENGAQAGSRPLTPATDVPIGAVATGERPTR